MIDGSHLAGALFKNSLYFYTLLFTHPTIQIIPESDVLYVTSSMRDETYNNVWKTDFTEETVDQRIVDIQKIFGDQPFIWWVDPSDTPTDLGTHLEAHGGLLVDQTNILYRMQGTPLVPYDDITVIKVASENLLSDFCKIKGDSAQAVALHKVLFQKFVDNKNYPISLYVAYHENIPVSIAVTVMFDTIGSIHSFATAARYQGKGYGAQLLSYLLQQLYAHGCTHVLLDASPDVVPFYTKHGFHEINQYIKGYRFTHAINE